MTYVSSIINKYGDIDNVKNDVKVLNEILSRQSKSLLIDVMASFVGDCALKYKYTEAEKMLVVNSLVAELRESLLERL